VGGVLPLPVLSPCNKVDMGLGTDASFEVGFVFVAEACIIASTGSGRSYGTNCGELHPLTQVCQSRTQVGGFLGGVVGGPSPRVCCWTPISASSGTGSGSASGSSVSMSSRGAAKVGAKQLNM